MKTATRTSGLAAAVMPHLLRVTAGIRRKVAARPGADQPGQRTTGCRERGEAQREATRHNKALGKAESGPPGTVSDFMAKMRQENKNRASSWHHKKGAVPRPGDSYRSARRNKARRARW